MWQQPPSQGLLHIKKNKKAAKGPGIEVDVDGITPSPPPILHQLTLHFT